MKKEQVKVNIEDYIKLYEGGLRLNQIKPLTNSTYKLFASSGVDIRIINRQDTVKNFYAFQRTDHFIMNNEYFYMIPVTTIKGTLVGFILRGVNSKSYSTVSREFSEIGKKVPLMFGFDEKFKSYDEHCLKKGKALPIIICEGSKDCMALKKLYPYVLANNTSSLGANLTVLRNISDRFLLAYDNDEAGVDGTIRDKRLLRSKGCFVDSVKLDEGFKDCADYVENPVMFKKLANRIKRQLNTLFNS